ncbi:MAG: ABC transporter ATP-binding protein [Clostridiales bacterium]|nr:ABC transporter ATP-binding protein [Clostridiales bacterium]
MDSIEMCNITKIFGNTKACDNVTLKIKSGEIHALLGENGAGKSTLMSILSGFYKPDKGYIKKNNKIIRIENPREANKFGFGMVYQHFKLIKNFTALENITLGVEDTRFGFICNYNARKKINYICNIYNFKIDLDKKVCFMSVAEQQRVEILKLLYRDNDILIFDEATAVLMPHEVNGLLKMIKKLAKENKIVLFITHKLDEIKAIAKKCSVMRKGKLIDCVDVNKISEEELSEIMMGKKIDFEINKISGKDNKIKINTKKNILEIRNVCSKNIKNISFKIYESEILGIAGIDGNGQNELVNLLTGLDKSISGDIVYNKNINKNINLSKLSIFERNKFFSFIPEDRHKHGLVLDYSVAKNLALKKYFDKSFRNKYFIDVEKINNYSKELIKKYDIRANDSEKTLSKNLSGGNQQKIIIARELELNKKIIITVQPTRGLDIGATNNVHNYLIKQRELNNSILLISLDIDEILSLSDRILILYQKKIVTEVDPKKISKTELGLYMSGTKSRKSS